MFQKMEPRTEMKNKQFAVEGTVKYTDDGGKEKCSQEEIVRIAPKRKNSSVSRLILISLITFI